MKDTIETTTEPLVIEKPLLNLEYPILNECGFKRSLTKDNEIKVLDIKTFEGRPENLTTS